jgi:hypothetical protein
MCKSAIAFVAALLLTTSVFGQTTIAPGERASFPTADIKNRGVPFPAGAFATGLCYTDPIAEVPGGSQGDMALTLSGVNSLVGARCSVFQQNDFTVEGDEGVVLAQISGTLQVGGVLAMVGAGRTKAAYAVNVLDITDGTPRVVSSTVLGVDELVGQILTPQFGTKIGIEGGGPYIGAEASLSIAIQLPITIKRVDNTFNFDLKALLRRGRVYRVMVTTAGALDVEAGVGLGFVLFPNLDISAPLRQIPNLLNPDNWMDLLPLRSLAGQNVCGLQFPDFDIGSVISDIPSLDFTIPELDFRIPKLDAGPFTLFGGDDITILNETDINIMSPQTLLGSLPTDPTQLLTTLGLPATVDDVFQCLVDISSGENMVLDEILPNVGISVPDLNVTLQDDEIEVVNDFVLVKANEVLTRINQSSFALNQRVDEVFNQLQLQLFNSVTILTDQIVAESTALETKIDTDFANMTTELIDQSDALTELIETDFDDLAERLEQEEQDALRLLIEETLAEARVHTIGQFFLPEDQGGKLELVREIVIDTIEKMLVAGEDIYRAEMELMKGDVDAGRGEFKLAFWHYYRAYQEAVFIMGLSNG